MKTILATVMALGLSVGMTLSASAQVFNVNVSKTTIIGNGNQVNNINQGSLGSGVSNNTFIQGNGNLVNNVNGGGGFLPQPGFRPMPQPGFRPVYQPTQIPHRPVCGTGLLPRPCGTGLIRPVQQFPMAPRGPVSNFTQIQGNFNRVNNFHFGG